MKAIRINLMDFGQEHFLASQVSQIFDGSTDPAFQIDIALQSENQTPSAIKWLEAHADGDSAALTIFVFERCPSDPEVALLLKTAP